MCLVVFSVCFLCSCLFARFAFLVGCSCLSRTAVILTPPLGLSLVIWRHIWKASGCAAGAKRRFKQKVEQVLHRAGATAALSPRPSLAQTCQSFLFHTIFMSREDISEDGCMRRPTTPPPPPPQRGSITCLLAPCTTLAPLPRTTQFKLGSHWAAVMYETAFRSDCRIDWSPSQLCTQSFSLSNLLTLGCPQAVCVGHPLVSPLRFTHQIGTAITSPVIICHKNTVNGDQHGGAIKSSRVWDGVSTSSIRHSGETWGLSAG